MRRQNSATAADLGRDLMVLLYSLSEVLVDNCIWEVLDMDLPISLFILWKDIGLCSSCRMWDLLS